MLLKQSKKFSIVAGFVATMKLFVVRPRLEALFHGFLDEHIWYSSVSLFHAFINIDRYPRPGYYSCPNLSHSARRSELAIAALWI